MSSTSGISSVPESAMQTTSLYNPSTIESTVTNITDLLEDPHTNPPQMDENAAIMPGTRAPSGSAPASEALPRSLNNDRPESVVPNGIPVRLPTQEPARGAPGGKGRGRGRGTRAPSNMAQGDSITVVPPTPAAASLPERTTPQATPPRGRGRGARRSRGTRASRGGARQRPARGGGGKRKRSKDDDDDDDDEEENGAGANTSDSENFTPQQHSRSGRRITQPVSAVPTIKLESASPPPPCHIPTFLTPALAALAPSHPPPPPPPPPPPTSVPPLPTPTPPAAASPLPRRRAPGAAAVCTSCGRGASPAANLIVFCDACNKPWHQLCHDPPLRAAMAQIEASEWFCADCDGLRRDRAALAGCVSAEETGWGYAERRRRLMGVGTERLVSLLMVLAGLHPRLAVFPAVEEEEEEEEAPSGGGGGVRAGALAAPGRAVAVDATAAAAAAAPPNGTGHAAVLQPLPPPPPPPAPAPAPEPEEEAHITYYESEPLPYPKAGNGIRLLPESYESWLDDDVGADGVFSHVRWNEVGNGEWVSKRDLVASVA